MTVRHKRAAMTSSTGREADTWRHGENGAKTVKAWRWSCCDGEMSVVASTDIPADVTAGPYPGGLDFAARTSDIHAVTTVVKVGWREHRLSADNDNHPFTHGASCKLHPVPDKSQRWMMALKPARDRYEQNVEVLAEGGCLVLRVLKAIPRGERLLMWYSDSLARVFGVPFLTPAHIRGNQQYTCTSCHTSFLYPNTLKAHILFKCKAIATRTASPSLTTPSAFSFAMSTPPSLILGSGPSAFHRSSSSSRSTPYSTVRMRDAPSMSSTGKCDWDHSSQSPHRTYRSEGGNKKTLTDKRSMTPDSSTDDASALNLSTRRLACSSNVPTVTSPACSDVRHSAPSNPAVTGSVPATGQPIQIFNHIHPPGLPALPLPLDQHMAWRLYYPWLAALPDPNPTKLLCAPVPAHPTFLDTRHHFSCHPQNRSFMFPHFVSPGPDHQSLLMTSTAKPPPVSPRGTMPTTRPDVPRDALSGNMTHSASSSLTATIPSSSSKTRVPLLTVPSEKEGEPLDLLPASFFANKSRKGHLCLYCGKLYSRKYGLKIHLRTHTGYKPLKCKVCLRPFGDPSNLNKHVRLHAEGDTPYRCDYCGKVLVRRRDLERHIRSRHPSVTETKEEDDVSTECQDSEVDVTSDTESTLDGGEQEIEVT
ncbi:uncharacterized protein LOC143283551 [Babylonia areolata]|uniref:uncharacterized protein LOC143283551 n=1 Tax=Babylonia areolata TaxID=304850 RepID=UPI003FD2702D